MKVLLYFENIEKIKKSGIGRAMKHQMAALTSAGVDFTINKNDKDYDLVHINTLFGGSKKLIKECKKKNIPVIVHGHSTYEDFRDSFRWWRLVSLYFYPHLTYMYKHAGMIITPTPYSKKLIEGYHLCDDVKDLSNGIDLEEYKHDDSKVEAFKKHFGITNEKVVIGVGFPFPRKGIQDFLEIAKKHPDVKFIWFGYLQKILTQQWILRIMKHKPDNVILPGYIDNSIIKGAMQYANCVLFPSYEETEGIVVLEGLASRVPVLVRRIGVYDPWLKEDINCFMASNNDEFSNKIDYILNNDNSKIIEEGYKVVQERTLDKIGLKLKEYYEEFYNKVKKG